MYNPKKTKIVNIIRYNLPILEDGLDNWRILETLEIIKSRKQSPYLQFFSYKSIFSNNNEEPHVVKRIQQLQMWYIPIQNDPNKYPNFISKMGGNLFGMQSQILITSCYVRLNISVTMFYWCSITKRSFNIDSKVWWWRQSPMG